MYLEGDCICMLECLCLYVRMFMFVCQNVYVCMLEGLCLYVRMVMFVCLKEIIFVCQKEIVFVCQKVYVLCQKEIIFVCQKVYVCMLECLCLYVRMYVNVQYSEPIPSPSLVSIIIFLLFPDNLPVQGDPQRMRLQINFIISLISLCTKSISFLFIN